MVDSGLIKDAIKKYGPIQDRFILRLGKEAGEFEKWHATRDDLKSDIVAFLACLKLFNIHTQIEERMRVQKKFIKALKKEAKMKAKQLAKEQAKLQKAMEKAERKRIEKEEKEKIKAEAKLRREQEKATKKTKVLAETKTEPIRSVDARAEGSGGIPREGTGIHEIASEKEKEVSTVPAADSNQQFNAPSVVLSKSFFEEEPEIKRSLIPEE